MQASSHERWEVLHATSDEVEASILQGLLESAGIPTVRQRLGAHVYGAGWVNILVPYDRIEEARRVINEAQHAAGPKEGDNGHYGT